MKRILIYICFALVVVGCSKQNEGGGGSARLKSDTDSVAYIIGLNVGQNLIRMDSTLNVAALCEGIRDVFREKTRLTDEEAEAYFLRYMNYILPEQARAYEEQFLADMAADDRTLVRTKTGVTYTIDRIGDQERIPSSSRDSLQLRLRIASTDGRELYSSYERGDTLRLTLNELRAGLQESVKLIGEGGKLRSWIPSSLAYGADGSEEFGVQANSTACYEIELVKLDTYSEWNRRRNLRR